MEGDIAEMGKFIGAGLATIGLGGAGIGVGNIASSFLAGALRNPSAAPGQTANLFVGIAFAEEIEPRLARAPVAASAPSPVSTAHRAPTAMQGPAPEKLRKL